MQRQLGFSLQGLREIGLHVEVLQYGDGAASLADKPLRAVLTDRLNQLGIGVLSSEEVEETRGKPCLYACVSLLRLGSGRYAYSTVLELLERVSLERNGATHVTAAIWEARNMGVISEKRLAFAIRADLWDRVEEFFDEHLHMNPKRRAVPKRSPGKEEGSPP